jgi:hypothetical protein
VHWVVTVEAKQIDKDFGALGGCDADDGREPLPRAACDAVAPGSRCPGLERALRLKGQLDGDRGYERVLCGSKPLLP